MFFFKNGLKFVRVGYTYDRKLLCGFQSKVKGPKQSITAHAQTVVHLGISWSLIFATYNTCISCRHLLNSAALTGCPEEIGHPLFPGSGISYNWTDTVAGSSQTLPCSELRPCQEMVGVSGGMVVHKCTTQGEWLEVDFSGCGFSVTTLQLCESSQLSKQVMRVQQTQFATVCVCVCMCMGSSLASVEIGV